MKAPSQRARTYQGNNLTNGTVLLVEIYDRERRVASAFMPHYPHLSPLALGYRCSIPIFWWLSIDGWRAFGVSKKNVTGSGCTNIVIWVDG